MRMRWNRKQMVMWLLTISVVAAVVAAGAARYFAILPPVVSPARETGYPELDDVAGHIRQHGITPDLGGVLKQAAVSIGTPALYVAEEDPSGDVPHRVARGPVIAAYPRDLIGLPAESAAPLSGLRELRLVPRMAGMTGGVMTHVVAPDGKTYLLFMVTTSTPRAGLAFGLVAAVVAALLSWIALAVWVYMDARDFGSGAAAGWFLLTLLSGPVSMAVWLIHRRTTKPEPVCPGCGSNLVNEASFCVRCGHAVKPACPACHRPVEVDWSYCSTCGHTLSEEQLG